MNDTPLRPSAILKRPFFAHRRFLLVFSRFSMSLECETEDTESDQQLITFHNNFILSFSNINVHGNVEITSHQHQ